MVAAGGHRQPRGFGRRDRFGNRRQGSARRLYADDGHHGEHRDQPRAVQKTPVRSGARFRAGDAGGLSALRDGRDAIAAGTHGAGVARARTGQARRTELRVDGQRQRGTSDG